MSKETAKSLAKVIFALLLVTGCLGMLIIKARDVDFVLAQAKKNPKEDKRPSPENNYLFSEATPAGDWLGQAEFDISQYDPKMPVIIVGIRSYVGKGNWRKHLMIESIVLKNRSPNAIKSFRLGWIIMTEEDRIARKNREAALLEGYTELIDADGARHGGRTKPFYFEVLKAAKTLIKNGALRGTFFLRIRLSEVHFEDDSIWTEYQSVAFRSKYSHANARSSQLPNCSNDQCYFHENGQGYCNEVSLEGYHCQRHLCSAAEPEACYCDTYRCSECNDQDNDGWYDCENDW